MPFFLNTLAVMLFIAAIITLIPYPGATDTSILGYKAMCSFAPVSTFILLIGTSTCRAIAKRKKQ